MQAASSSGSDGDDDGSSSNSSAHSSGSSSQSGSSSSGSSSSDGSSDNSDFKSHDGDGKQNKTRIRKNSIPTTITVNTSLNESSATITNTTTQILPPATIASPQQSPPPPPSRKRKRFKRHNIHVPFQYPYESLQTHRQKLSVNAKRFKKRKISREAKTHALMQILAPLQGKERVEAIKKILINKQNDYNFPGEIPRGMLSSSSEEEEEEKPSAKSTLGKWEKENDYVGEMDYHRRDWIDAGRGWRGRRALFDTIPVAEISNLVGWATTYSGDREEEDSEVTKKRVESSDGGEAVVASNSKNFSSELASSFAIPPQQDLLHHPAPPPPPSNLTFLAECTADKIVSNIHHIKNIAFDREQIRFEKRSIRLREHESSSSSSSSSSQSSHDDNDDEDSTYKLFKSHKPLKSAKAWVPVKKHVKRGKELTSEEKMKITKLRSMYRAFDDTALVALGMATEEVLTAALMPLARVHVARCRMLECRETWKGTQTHLDDGVDGGERCEKQTSRPSAARKDAVLSSSGPVSEKQIDGNSFEKQSENGEEEAMSTSDSENSNAASVDSNESDGSIEGSNSKGVDTAIAEIQDEKDDQQTNPNDNTEGQNGESHKNDTTLDTDEQPSQAASDAKSTQVINMYVEESETPFDAWTLPPTEAIVGLVPFRSTFLERQKLRKDGKLSARECNRKVENNLSYLPSALPPSIPCDDQSNTIPTPNGISDSNQTSGITYQDERDMQMAASSLRWCKKHKLRSDFVSKNMELYGLFLPTPPKKQFPVDYLSVSEKLPPLDKAVSRSRRKQK